ncbi:MAG: metallophosphoesterase [Candidatus Lokiarchaeota archaeon]|nr:metallophosphoesterase [Candidatus Lokiarchaeota archaeon]
MFADIPDAEPAVISPNLGIPAFLDQEARVADSKDVYRFTVNIIGPRQLGAAQVHERLAGSIVAVPLFEVVPGTRRLRRGTPLPLRLAPVQETPCLLLGTSPLASLYQNRQDRPSYLLRHDFFGKNRALFHTTASLDFAGAPAECRDWLRGHPFLMFDLVQSYGAGTTAKERTCYHAIVLRNKDYTSFHVAQITDIHLARRYDEVLDCLSGFLGPFGDILDMKRVVDFFKGRFRRASREKRVQDEIFRETEYRRFNPLNRRFQNPNNKLRQFIIWANQAAAREHLDLVLITGDILDYCQKEDVQKTDYSLGDTNWDLFLRIMLNLPVEYRAGCEPTKIVRHEELAVPVFTLPGNHDLRVHGYPLPAMNYYKYFGLTRFEAMLYKDPVKLSVEKSLAIDKYCLKPYYQHINPFDDYYVKLGDRLFIMLNSGADSFLNIKSLLMANPGCVGFKDTQLTFCRRVLEACAPACGDGSTSLFVSHSPILNPALRGAIWKSIQSALRGKKYAPPESYKEANLRAHGRADTNVVYDLDFGIGTISRNRDQVLKFLFKHRMTALCGHTHLQREFRFRFTGKPEEMEPMGMDDILKKKLLEIRWDDYTDNESPAFVQENRPFVLQTPSLGIRRQEEKRDFGAFREVTFLGDRLEGIQVRYLSRLGNEF